MRAEYWIEGPVISYPVASWPIFQEVFNLEEGPVTLAYPSNLSLASYQDLADHIEISLRKAKRRATNLEREEYGRDPE